MGNEIVLTSSLAFLGGLFLGVVFFGGLRITLNEVTRSGNKIWILPFSFFLRSFITVFGVWWIARDSLLLIGFCMLGWILARFLFIYFERKYLKIRISQDKV